MEDYESLRAFLEHVALVMDAERAEEMDAVSIMTLHSAKGLEFETVFLPGWEEGLFPHQARARRRGPLRSRGRAPARLCRADARQEEPASLVRLEPPHSRALAVDHPVALPRRTARGPCRGCRNRSHLWRLRHQSGHPRRRVRRGVRAVAIPTEPHASMISAPALRLRPVPGGRGWPLLLEHLCDARLGARAEEPHRGDRPQLGLALRPRGGAHRLRRDGIRLRRRSRFGERPHDRRRTGGEIRRRHPSAFQVGDRVFHQKFGNGNVSAIEGNKLTIDFDKAGQKRVLDGFVTGA